MKYSFIAFLLAFYALTGCYEDAGNPTPMEATIENISDPESYASENERAAHLFEYYSLKLKDKYPTWSTSLGFEGFEGRWWKSGLEALQSNHHELLQLDSLCETFEESELDEYHKTYFRLMANNVKDGIAYFQNDLYYFPVSQQFGIHQAVPSVLSRHKVNTKEDIRNLMQLFDSADEIIEGTLGIMKEGVSKGLTPPRVTMVGVAEQIRTIVDTPIDDSPLYKALTDLDHFDAAEQEEFRNTAKDKIQSKIIPALVSLADYVETEYMQACRESIGISELSGGEEKYAYLIASYTTTDLTAKQVHEKGLKEVQRILEEMEEIREKSGFKGDLSAFNEYLRTDPKFFHNSREELLTGYRDICKRIDPELVKLFGKLPRLPYGVIPVPEYLEEHYTTARYQGGSFESGLGGQFLANTYDLKSRPKWEMEALSLHEAVPGHHLQISLEQEIEGQPDFKKFLHYTVYVEGWGLYAESLGEDLGMYQDIYSKYGQLTYEMWRAIRLVVDTGIHAFGWTRQEAIDYFEANSAKTEKDIEVEVDRYIGWPGQALAYKIGELKIKELRRSAEDKLGVAFDIREFHDFVLSMGSVPLNVLEKGVQEWIDAGKESS